LHEAQEEKNLIVALKKIGYTSKVGGGIIALMCVQKDHQFFVPQA
jgi:hypothetical protein